ncbi:membrane integrity-associated transporter subunit PqiC [Xenophilus sp. Marseille-Q4582]|uniref:PqiC family protein n=1 Tax=Xenophilus sp. Marseille-Q4582 TaxID=2866600 RepID=UPI001CE4063F|nr:PqiC family protein [Xenophilus sp. Marseille-Q4582]
MRRFAEAWTPAGRLATGAAWAAALLLAGCASVPDRYYTLAPSPHGLPAAAAAAHAPLAIEVAPVGVPERLARPQMVLRSAGAAEVRVLEQHRWASSFEQELRDALGSGVAARLGAADVTRGGRTPGQAVWRIGVQVQAFEAVEDAQVDTRLQWRLRRPDGTDAGGCAWAGQEAVSGGIDAVAQGAQRLTARVAEALARQITALQGGAVLRCEG